MFTLIVPALVLTGLVWLFGGWVKGDEMPNPAMSLVGWAVDF